MLYDRAADDIKRGRHEVGRLNLQTLINTYPDSEYLAKAKLLIADSYYKEGGTANMTQAISGYKDFIVFFPFLPEASYAQLQVAMGHFQQMEKPDRDRTEAKEAEAEFQTFLQKYPKDPLADKAMQHLREVQEVIAEGDFRVASYYYVKGDKRAAAARLIGITRRYPLFSKSDQAYWMLGQIFESSREKRNCGQLLFANCEELSAVSESARRERQAGGDESAGAAAGSQSAGVDGRGAERSPAAHQPGEAADGAIEDRPHERNGGGGTRRRPKSGAGSRHDVSYGGAIGRQLFAHRGGWRERNGEDDREIRRELWRR